MSWRTIIATVSVAGLTAAALLAPAASDATAIFHKPRVAAHAATERNVGWTSSNWSGYAETSTTPYNAITGAWTVPAVSATKRASYSSNWIGIDGYNNSDLIQTGTESDYYNGATHYAAWWEILPAAETPIAALTVHAGDKITASITHGTGTSWTISISDTTTGKSYTTVQNYTGPQTSAEWIEEAPTVGGRVATLAHFGTATFDPGTVDGGNPGLTAAESGAMVQNRVQVATPSTPDADTDGFQMAYGASAPTPPAS